jgi:hypothetical protein
MRSMTRRAVYLLVPGLRTKHCIEGFLKRNDSIGMNIERAWAHPRHPLKRIFKKGVVPDEVRRCKLTPG